jgi:hypothetical protein
MLHVVTDAFFQNVRNRIPGYTVSIDNTTRSDVVVVWLGLLLCIREVLGSNPDPGIGCSDAAVCLELVHGLEPARTYILQIFTAYNQQMHTVFNF